MLQTKVLIIGGGATGTAVARDLALRGAPACSPSATTSTPAPRRQPRPAAQRRPLRRGRPRRGRRVPGGGRDPQAAGARSASRTPAGCSSPSRATTSATSRPSPGCARGAGIRRAPCPSPRRASSSRRSRSAPSPRTRCPTRRSIRSSSRSRAWRRHSGSARGCCAAPGSSASSARAAGSCAARLRHAPHRRGDCASRPRVVVNAAGAWAREVAALGRRSTCRCSTRRARCVVTHARLAHRVLNRLRPPSDADIVMPGGTVSIVGTTSITVPRPRGHAAHRRRRSTSSSRRRRRCCRRSRHALHPRLRRGAAAGRRRRRRPTAAASAAASRSSTTRRDGVANLVTITGGKLTTCRLMAERTADLVCERLGVAAPCRTRERAAAADGRVRVDRARASRRGPGCARTRPTTRSCASARWSRTAPSTPSPRDLERRRPDAPRPTSPCAAALGKGACQGTFCAVRAVAHLYDRGVLTGDRGGARERRVLPRALARAAPGAVGRAARAGRAGRGDPLRPARQELGARLPPAHRRRGRDGEPRPSGTMSDTYDLAWSSARASRAWRRPSSPPTAGSRRCRWATPARSSSRAACSTSWACTRSREGRTGRSVGRVRGRRRATCPATPTPARRRPTSAPPSSSWSPRSTRRGSPTARPATTNCEVLTGVGTVKSTYCVPRPCAGRRGARRGRPLPAGRLPGPARVQRPPDRRGARGALAGPAHRRASTSRRRAVAGEVYSGPPRARARAARSTRERWPSSSDRTSATRGRSACRRCSGSGARRSHRRGARRRALGVPVFEIPTMPTSVPGLRLKDALERAVAARGVRRLVQGRVVAVVPEERGASRSHLDGEAPGPPPLRARAVVLATGRFMGGGPRGRPRTACARRCWTCRWCSPRRAPTGTGSTSSTRAAMRSTGPGSRSDERFRPRDASGRPRAPAALRRRHDPRPPRLGAHEVRGGHGHRHGLRRGRGVPRRGSRKGPSAQRARMNSAFFWIGLAALAGSRVRGCRVADLALAPGAGRAGREAVRLSRPREGGRSSPCHFAFQPTPSPFCEITRPRRPPPGEGAQERYSRLGHAPLHLLGLPAASAHARPGRTVDAGSVRAATSRPSIPSSSCGTSSASWSSWDSPIGLWAARPRRETAAPAQAASTAWLSDILGCISIRACFLEAAKIVSEPVFREMVEEYATIGGPEELRAPRALLGEGVRSGLR